MRANHLDAAATIVAGLKMAGLTALAVGERDLVYGLKAFRRLRDGAGFPLLCANLLEARSGRLLAKPSLLVRLSSGWKVGIVAAIGQKFTDVRPGYFKKRGVRISSPAEAVRREVKRLERAGADAIVLLAHMHAGHARALLGRVQGIDLAFHAHDRSWASKPLRVGRAVLYPSRDRGQFVGVLQVKQWGGAARRGSGSRLVSRAVRIRQLEAALMRLKRRIALHRKKAGGKMTPAAWRLVRTSMRVRRWILELLGARKARIIPSRHYYVRMDSRHKKDPLVNRLVGACKRRQWGRRRRARSRRKVRPRPSRVMHLVAPRFRPVPRRGRVRRYRTFRIRPAQKRARRVIFRRLRKAGKGR